MVEGSNKLFAVCLREKGNLLQYSKYNVFGRWWYVAW